VVEIGNILHHLGNPNRSFEHRARNLFVQLSQRREVFRILRPKNRVGRLQEIGNCAAFAHEFRVVANREIRPAFFAATSFDCGNHQRFCRPRQNCAA